MSIVIDKILGKPLMHSHIALAASAPSGSNGDLWYNTSTAELAIYYGGWNVIGTGTPPVTLGSPMGLLLTLTYAS